jgi:hypothetical protein
MSIRTGPVEPDLIFARLGLCFIEWSYFGSSSRALLEEQVRLAWRQSPDRLAVLARAPAAPTPRSALPKAAIGEARLATERRIAASRRQR